jgi:hypothetical protein
MITKDVQAYAISNWGDFLSPVTELSKSDNGVSLVHSSVELYNFDGICKSLFAQGKLPTSADGLDFNGRTMELVEYKSGFKQRITKHNFDPAKGRCPDPDVNRVCEDYWKLFFKNQQTNISELISSIRNKAVESYVTLEKQVFPRCQDAGRPMQLKLIVVIDEDEIDSMEDTYSELAGNTDAEDNHFSAIKSALRRLVNLRDADGNAYFYDSIEVLSVQDYLNKLKLMT